jgi:hypothetical protein
VPTQYGPRENGNKNQWMLLESDIFQSVADCLKTNGQLIIARPRRFSDETDVEQKEKKTIPQKRTEATKEEATKTDSKTERCLKR